MKKIMNLTILIAIMLFASFTTKAQLLEENFNYTAGDTLAANWTGHSTGTPIYIQSGSLSYTNYPSNSNNCARMATGNDYSRTFTSTPVSSGNLYFAMLINIDSARTQDYFFHTFRTGGSTSFYNRIYVKKASNGSLAFGILKGSTTTNIKWSDSIYAANTTHLLVLKVQIVAGTTNDIPSLFINPTLNGVEPTATITATDITSTDYTDYDRIALRQASPSSYAALRIDGIRVGTAWTDAVGMGGNDVTPPSVVSATALTATSVKIIFNESVSQSSAQNVSNYGIKDVNNNIVAISNAVLSNGTQVILTLASNLTVNTNYTLSVNGITDMASTPNTMATAQQLTINYNPVGVNQNNISTISVYPNPVKNYLHINLDGNYNISIVSLLGQNVYQNNNVSGNLRVDCSKFGQGIFFVQSKNDEGKVITKRIVIE